MSGPGVSPRTMRSRVLRALERASDAELEAGALWYRAARLEAVRIAEEHGLEERAAAGVIAAWSPRRTWSDNLRAARDAAAGLDPPGLTWSRDRARWILGGVDPLEVLTGRKTASFYRNILGDVSAVTVDVWAARVVGVSESGLKRAGAYDAVTSAYRSAARALELTPAQAQATAWVQIRGAAD